MNTQPITASYLLSNGFTRISAYVYAKEVPAAYTTLNVLVDEDIDNRWVGTIDRGNWSRRWDSETATTTLLEWIEDSVNEFESMC